MNTDCVKRKDDPGSSRRNPYRFVLHHHHGRPTKSSYILKSASSLVNSVPPIHPLPQQRPVEFDTPQDEKLHRDVSVLVQLIQEGRSSNRQVETSLGKRAVLLRDASLQHAAPAARRVSPSIPGELSWLRPPRSFARAPPGVSHRTSLLLLSSPPSPSPLVLTLLRRRKKTASLPSRS